MTEIDPIAAMRAKLKPRQEARAGTGTGDIDGQLDALMAEISETIPPRDMTLGDGKRQETRLLVARPHLLRVGRARPVAHATVPLPPDMQGDRAAPLIAAFQDRVRRFVAAAADPSITAARAACRVEPTEPGCPSMRCARSPAMKGPLLKAPVGACLARAAAGPKDRLRDPARASARRSAAGPGRPRHRGHAAAGARHRAGRNRRSLPPRRPA
ncbi:hypothetical protein CCR90_02050 [Rhodovulum sulfidophilum]|uniref:hypothetical protein n=1 Tax=Rhodovulum sulfidophilum TaxID=35806 RepID=UPI0019139F8E|nr:hypothetical protein [Rhodovulum sulfidophilum]MBK5922577.1 hypothetical protein [Rhodovulum sulfidophilum]